METVTADARARASRPRKADEAAADRLRAAGGRKPGSGAAGEGAAAGAAQKVGLVYVTEETPGLTRRRAGSGFAYLDADGKAVRDKKVLTRIRKLAIPPAWEQVWICADPAGHLQATGRDAKGRKQYRYHADFRAAQDDVKYDRLLDFAAALPAIRARIDADMSARGLPRRKVLATIVHLLDTTLIRIGNPSYARDNDSYGLSTLRDRHVRVNGNNLRFQFKGKSGKSWQLHVQDRRVAKIVRSCQELPGQHLFQYLDESGVQQRVSSTDVNAYLREVTGRDITAKDFRTWAGTVMTALHLFRMEAPKDKARSQTEAKRQARRVLEEVAHRLGNTVTICRKCYVHPLVLEAHLAGTLRLRLMATRDVLRPEEAATLRFLRRAA
jgi:DNA topoisomerase I